MLMKRASQGEQRPYFTILPTPCGNKKELAVNKNLYIGNLSNEVTEEDLKTNFSELGKVSSVRIIKDRDTGMSKGFGFVEMETAEQAQEVIKRFNGGELCGKTIAVSEAKPKKDQGRPMGGGRGPGRGGFGGGRGGGFGGGRGGDRGGRGRY